MIIFRNLNLEPGFEDKNQDKSFYLSTQNITMLDLDFSNTCIYIHSRQKSEVCVSIENYIHSLSTYIYY